MREIKFRAWDKENNFMFYSKNNYPVSKYDLGFNFVGENEFRLMRLIDIEDSLFKRVDAEIMQYTGMKDKNGKEIYEGDIIESDKETRYKVVFNKGCFKVQNIEHPNLNLYLLEDYSSDYIEVIGYIYEDKDLLK